MEKEKKLLLIAPLFHDFQYIYNPRVKLHIHLWSVAIRFIFPQFCKSDMSRYGYLEIFQSLLDFEITRVDLLFGRVWQTSRVIWSIYLASLSLVMAVMRRSQLPRGNWLTSIGCQSVLRRSELFNRLTTNESEVICANLIVKIRPTFYTDFTCIF